MSKSVAFHTLGCKLNFSETSSLSRSLEAEGFIKTEFDQHADVYVINTCSVTENADKECRQLVRRIQRRAPESMVVIRSEEHTSELQSRENLVCRLLLEKQ